MMENNLKTILLLGALTGLILAFGWLLGGQNGVMIALVFAALTNLGAWWFSDSIAMSMNRAQQVSPQQAPELHQMIGELAQRAGLPMPTVWVVNSPVPNAFATGRSPEKGAVAVTTGLMQTLSREEVAGVVAHELAHIKNRDTLISSVAATIAGALTTLAGMARWGMLMGGGYGYGSRDRNGGSALGAFGALFMMILAPIAAAIIQAAISRSREFVADEAGARIMGNPLPLASALQTLESANQQMMVRGGVPPVNPATAHMYIVNPLQSNASAGLGGLAGLFSTHPPTRERVARLQALAREIR
ncbi:MAG: zinc metalloprotease HtpX [Anaerolineae bacterium]|nr:zinc metalloprotease HtpX [Anaerolineae bacterium]